MERFDRFDACVLAASLAVWWFAVGYSTGGCLRHHVDWPKVVECASAGVQLGDVVDALRDDEDSEARLEQLATRYGAKAILCAINDFVQSLQYGMAAPSEDDKAAARRGAEFLSHHGVTIVVVE